MDVDEAVQSICESTVSSGTGFKSWPVAWECPGPNKCNSFWRHFQCSLLSLIAQASLSEGCRLPVRMTGTNDWPLAEIISIKEQAEDGNTWYYVHYVDCEYWVERDEDLGQDY